MAMPDFDWDIRRTGRAWKGEEARHRWELTPEKFEMYQGKLFWDDEQRVALLGAVMSLVDRGLISMSFRFADECARVQRLLRRYQDRPMSLADACLLRMRELIPDSAVMTLDADFRIYRRNGREVVPVIAPEG